MPGTCGDPNCHLQSGHGGDFHVGRSYGDGTYDMWPLASRREAIEAAIGTGLIRGESRMGLSDFDQTPQENT